MSDVTIDNHRAQFAFNGRMAELLKSVSDRYEILDISTREADLEEIFLTYYRDAPGGAGETETADVPC